MYAHSVEICILKICYVDMLLIFLRCYLKVLSVCKSCWNLSFGCQLQFWSSYVKLEKKV